MIKWLIIYLIGGISTSIYLSVLLVLNTIKTEGSADGNDINRHVATGCFGGAFWVLVLPYNLITLVVVKIVKFIRKKS